MKTIKRIAVVVSAVAFLAAVMQAQELSKQEWEQSMREAVQQRDDLKKEIAALDVDISRLKTENAMLAQQGDQCHQELLSLLGVTDAKLKAFAASLDSIDTRLTELSKLSNQDLYLRKADLDAVQAMITRASNQKMASMEEFAPRLDDERLHLEALRNSLKSVLANVEPTYVVGTWSKNHDCLWNIAKRPKVYGDAFLWPKIWQQNRTEIRNPDVIHPGEKLKIPGKSVLTAQEIISEKSYWHSKLAVASADRRTTSKN